MKITLSQRQYRLLISALNSYQTEIEAKDHPHHADLGLVRGMNDRIGSYPGQEMTILVKAGEAEE